MKTYIYWFAGLIFSFAQLNSMEQISNRDIEHSALEVSKKFNEEGTSAAEACLQKCDNRKEVYIYLIKNRYGYVIASIMLNQLGNRFNKGEEKVKYLDQVLLGFGSYKEAEELKLNLIYGFVTSYLYFTKSENEKSKLKTFIQDMARFGSKELKGYLVIRITKELKNCGVSEQEISNVNAKKSSNDAVEFLKGIARHLLTPSVPPVEKDIPQHYEEFSETEMPTLIEIEEPKELKRVYEEFSTELEENNESIDENEIVAYYRKHGAAICKQFYKIGLDIEKKFYIRLLKNGNYDLAAVLLMNEKTDSIMNFIKNLPKRRQKEGLLNSFVNLITDSDFSREKAGCGVLIRKLINRDEEIKNLFIFPFAERLLPIVGNEQEAECKAMVIEFIKTMQSKAYSEWLKKLENGVKVVKLANEMIEVLNDDRKLDKDELKRELLSLNDHYRFDIMDYILNKKFYKLRYFNDKPEIDQPIYQLLKWLYPDEVYEDKPEDYIAEIGYILATMTELFPDCFENIHKNICVGFYAANCKLVEEHFTDTVSREMRKLLDDEKAITKLTDLLNLYINCFGSYFIDNLINKFFRSLANPSDVIRSIEILREVANLMPDLKSSIASKLVYAQKTL